MPPKLIFPVAAYPSNNEESVLYLTDPVTSVLSISGPLLRTKPGLVLKFKIPVVGFISNSLSVVVTVFPVNLILPVSIRNPSRYVTSKLSLICIWLSPEKFALSIAKLVEPVS
jgi:hypothetical protein